MDADREYAGTLDDAQLRAYRDEGCLVLPDVVSPADLALVRDAVADLYRRNHPGRVLETDGETIRGVHGCHLQSELFSRLVRLPALLGVAEAVLDSKVYVHQSKVNAKRALLGESWPWHQDFTFWEREDGLPAPAVTNVALLLDDATSFNGPLLYLPGSHRHGTVSAPGRATPHGADWRSHLSADLEYALPVDLLAELTAVHGMAAAVGGAGSLVVFDPRLVHGSGTNMSPFDRQMAIITYNSVDNVPADGRGWRPDFLSAPPGPPLTALDGGLTTGRPCPS
ncbi:phytanoyl-CoA dioxygenase family protein [Pseudonocardia sp. ICBG1142]|uniref:phytanoyl-CoA dioxygenase family protein n=1 Tax=Pseudonocardia sp. ICBG1142 TaxID=2846760 RepID=UPI001CF6909E|nr:phytanoyl-CoA dioxygenase family protein [Pseudonocardia sp. ICBG1142]